MITKTNFYHIPSFEYITKLSPSEFEYFTKYLLEHLGYINVAVTKKYGNNRADAGIDCIAYQNEQKYLVQAKKWNKGYKDALPLHVIREHGGCMLRDKTYKGIITTTLTIDQVGRNEASLMNIELIGKDEIISTMKQINPSFNIESKQLHWFWRLLRWLLS